MVEDRGLVLVMVRGDHRVNDIKLQNALGAEFRPARAEEFADRVGPAGYIGPVGIDVPILLDDAVEPGVLHHRRQPRERAPARRRARPRLPVQARRRALGRGRRHRQRQPDPDRARDRGRQHLQARHALLGAARRDLPRRVGAVASRSGWAPTASARPASPAAAVEQYADEQGISWPRSMAPFDVHLVGLGKDGSEEREVAERLYERAARGRARGRLRRPRRRAGREVRRRRAARRAAAADRRARARSRSGEVEAQVRRGRETRSIPLEGAADAAVELWRSLP